MTSNLQLEQWLDEWLKGERSSEALEKLAAQEQVEDLALLQQEHRAAAVAVQRHNVLQQVQQVHQAFMQQRETTQANDETPVIPIRRPLRATWMRIAAAVVFILASATTWQYLANSPDKLFDEAYSTYYIDKNRGENGAEVMLMVNEFRAGNYKKVIEQYRQTTAPGPRELFLAGSAYLELNEPLQAVPVFQQIIDQNKNKTEKLYNDEAEYYQGLAYLRAQQYREAHAIFSRIKLDKNHTYHAKIDGWWLFRLRWL